MSIKSRAELEGLKQVSKIVKIALDDMASTVQPGITTAELAEMGAKVLLEHGTESSPLKVYGFPGAVCISVNDETIHGIPKKRILQSGDLVQFDLTAEKTGSSPMPLSL